MTLVTQVTMVEELVDVEVEEVVTALKTMITTTVEILILKPSSLDNLKTFSPLLSLKLAII
ncbi:MAG: hypothetical protein J6586_10925 [Snodgrassella sp.]|nr:hypothetical protein [Snodgrassella sp.]